MGIGVARKLLVRMTRIRSIIYDPSIKRMVDKGRLAIPSSEEPLITAFIARKPIRVEVREGDSSVPGCRLHDTIPVTSTEVVSSAFMHVANKGRYNKKGILRLTRFTTYDLLYPDTGSSR
jgi:hypothetical protein